MKNVATGHEIKEFFSRYVDLVLFHQYNHDEIEVKIEDLESDKTYFYYDCQDKGDIYVPVLTETKFFDEAQDVKDFINEIDNDNAYDTKNIIYFLAKGNIINELIESDNAPFRLETIRYFNLEDNVISDEELYCFINVDGEYIVYPIGEVTVEEVLIRVNEV